MAELNQKCKQLNANNSELKLKIADLQKIEGEEEQAREDSEIRQRWSKLTGKPYEGNLKLGQVDRNKSEIGNLRASTAIAEKEILEGMKQLIFDVFPDPSNIPAPDTEKNALLKFEGEPLEDLVQFIATTLSSGVPVRLDNISLYPDKIKVSCVEKISDEVESMEIFVRNIQRMARIALQEKDPDVDEVATKLHDSRYRDIWEVIKGRKSISLQELYSELNIVDQKDERKNVQNFFTNSKIVLKDKFPFYTSEKGNYELNFFGALVWKHYQTQFLGKTETEQKDTDIEVSPITESNTNGETKDENKIEKTTLNGFFDNKKVKDTLYGTKV